jgi:hypothetical protein
MIDSKDHWVMVIAARMYVFVLRMLLIRLYGILRELFVTCVAMICLFVGLLYPYVVSIRRVIVECVSFIKLNLRRVLEQMVLVKEGLYNKVLQALDFMKGVVEEVVEWVRTGVLESGIGVEELRGIMLVVGIVVLLVCVYRRTRSINDVVILLIGINGVFIVCICLLLILMMEGDLLGEYFMRLVEWIASKITIYEEARDRIRVVVRLYVHVISGVVGWKLCLVIIECAKEQSFSPMWGFIKEVTRGLVLSIFSISILIVDWGISVMVIDFIETIIHGSIVELWNGLGEFLEGVIKGISEDVREVMEDILSGEEGVSLGKKEQVEEENKGKEEECVPVVNASISFGDGTVLDGGGYNPEGDVKVPEGDVKIPEGEVKIPEGDVKIPGEDEGNKGGLECFPIEDGKGFEGDDFSKDDDKDSFGSGGCVVGGKVGYRYYY